MKQKRLCIDSLLARENYLLAIACHGQPADFMGAQVWPKKGGKGLSATVHLFYG
jgi:hypothetical protein